MKKIMFIILLLLTPLIVYAETCDDKNIVIESFELDDQSIGVTELEESKVNGLTFEFHVKMNYEGDHTKYKLTLKNNTSEDYEINKKSIVLNSDYFDYTLTVDGSNIIKKGEVKSVFLDIEYKNAIPETTFLTSEFNENKNMSMVLSSKDQIVNPETATGTIIILDVILLILMAIVIIFLKKNVTKLAAIIIIASAIIIVPLTVRALCNATITIDANIKVAKPYTGPLYRSSNIQYKNGDRFIFEDFWCRPTPINSSNESYKIQDCYRDKNECEIDDITCTKKPLSSISPSDLGLYYYIKHDLVNGVIVNTYNCKMGYNPNIEYCFKADPNAKDENIALFNELHSDSVTEESDNLYNSGTHDRLYFDGSSRLGSYCGSCRVESDTTSYCNYGYNVC